MAAADQVLPHAALRLMHAQRRAPAKRRSLKRRTDALLVEAVPALVHRAEHGWIDIVCVVARGDADIGCSQAARERVHGRVEPPAFVIKTEMFDRPLAELALLVDGEMSVQALVAHVVC